MKVAHKTVLGEDSGMKLMEKQKHSALNHNYSYKNLKHPSEISYNGGQVSEVLWNGVERNLGATK